MAHACSVSPIKTPDRDVFQANWALQARGSKTQKSLGKRQACPPPPRPVAQDLQYESLYYGSDHNSRPFINVPDFGNNNLGQLVQFSPLSHSSPDSRKLSW